MKHIFLTAFVGFCLSSWAQDFPIPYNPDSDLNGLIGSPDLLSLLAVYGEEFSAAVVAEDNEAAIMSMGTMSYPECYQSCRGLPGQWAVSEIHDLGLVWDEIQFQGTNIFVWLQPNKGTEKMRAWEAHISNGNQIVETLDPSSSKRCYCSIEELPKVEYSFCNAVNNDGAFDACLAAKLEEGWYLVETTPWTYSSNSGTGVWSLAFWRWAE